NELHLVEQIAEQNNAAGAQICTLADTTSLMVQPSMAKQNQRLIPQPGSELTLTNRAESFTLETLSSNDFYWVNSLAVTSTGVVATTDYIQVSWPNTPTTTGKPVIEVFDYAPLWLGQHQPQLDKYGLFIEVAIKGVNLKLRYVPKGSFLMGSPEDEPERLGRETQHAVMLMQGFWLGETTVSQQLWQAVMGDNPSRYKADNNEILPVESVSWDDCQKFCERFNKLLPGFELTLPTEAQWEYACRAGTQTPFSTGQQLTTAQANYDGNHPYNDGAKGEWRETTVAVDKFPLNSWGLIQMHGNVWEWCQNSMQDYSKKTEIDPVGGSGRPMRVVRGGSWMGIANYCRSAYRSSNARDFANGFIGLRVTQVELRQKRELVANGD
ncbi:MAG: formylglycine-generating enzyme family protein, partial [Psychrosphaera sp.]|nr:formylglycine-generating enzyme family protein [Psychrosphaera sp.]